MHSEYSPLRRGHVVRARAPLRLGLAGGGTDVSPYCDDFGGAVLNITLHRFAYAFIAPRTDRKVELRSSDLAISETLELGAPLRASPANQLHLGVYQRMMRDYCGGELLPLTITTHADAPPGSGLGTSSAIVVALVDAFRTLLDLPLGQYDVAWLAFQIERNDLGLAGGRQDQYSAAFGGVNFMEFLPEERVIVNPLRIRQGHVDELEASMVICFTGVSRHSSEIVVDQSSRMTANNRSTMDALHQLKADAISMKSAMLNGDQTELTSIMQRSWIAKKRTATAVSNGIIDDLYDRALSYGALAGKVSGAGGGGFMMFIATPETRPGLLAALRGTGVSAEAVQFTDKGSETWTRPA